MQGIKAANNESQLKKAWSLRNLVTKSENI